MQRLLQVLFFITIISVVFASSAVPEGCHEGRVWITALDTECTRYDCHDNKVIRSSIPKPCEGEGEAYQFFIYPEVPEPPNAKLFQGLRDDPLNPYTGTTEPGLQLKLGRPIKSSPIKSIKPYPYTY